jgi:hypothetical protein
MLRRGPFVREAFDRRNFKTEPERKQERKE